MVADTLARHTRHALRCAQQAGLPTILLMDGLCEWRNTFANPGVGPGFLRPAPVSVVACCGPRDRDLLAELGNRAVATGLPRLAGIHPRPRPPAGAPLLVATARTPCFDDAERRRTIRALAAIRDRAAARSIRLTWRLTARLEHELGVANDTGPLGETLASCAGVLTTPSTLSVEAMLANRPVALLHPHACPLWPDAPLNWAGPDPCDTDLPTGLAALDRLLSELPALDDGLLRDALGRAAADPNLAAERLSDLIVDTARARPAPAAAPRAIVRIPTPAPKPRGTRRLVNVVLCDGEPIGGVPVWCRRLAAELARAGGRWRARTLYVSPRGWTPDPAADPHADLCVIDPALDHWQAIDAVRRALLALEPDAIAPNYGDVAHAAAAQLRYQGIPTIAAMHTDDETYRRTLSTYRDWDGAVGVSAVCHEFVRSLAAERPTAPIPYGVPVAAAARTPNTDRPLRIAYVGRMVQLQKRIGDLHGLIDGLERRGVACTFHLVGDGPDLDAWLARRAERPTRHVRVVCAGRRAPAWTTRLLARTDLSVLVSDFEGTSISMLEAMGAGVVPCVTRVASGTDEWIRPGVTGLCVPVGAVDEMAGLIARADADRAWLAGMSEAARRLAAERATVAGAARAWAELLDRVDARPVRTSPSDLGLRLTDGTRWTKTWADDPDGARAWIRDRLEEAGYASVRTIAPHQDPGGADACLVDGPASPASVRRVEALRASGRGAVLSPTLIEPAWARLAAVVARAQRDGAGRVAIYGCGRHTRRARALFEQDLPIVGLLDDRPTDRTMFGLPVVRTDDAIAELKPDCIVLSSDVWESRMWRRLDRVRRDGVRVLPVYGTYEAPDTGPTAPKRPA